MTSKLRQLAVVATGRVVELVAPGLGRDLDAPSRDPVSARLKRAIRHARLARARRAGDAQAVERLLGDFWRGTAGDRFHTAHSDARFDLFREAHHDVLDAVRAVMADAPGAFRRLVEIGCGDGRVLEYALAQLPDIERAVGIDINASVIESDAARNPRPEALSYVCGDGLDWLQTHAEPGTVLLTNGGVYEYFAPDRLDAVFAEIARAAPAAVALVEPLAPEHDLGTEEGSLVFGAENSFSHNYRARLTRAGFEIAHAREVTIEPTRWIVMVAVRAAQAS